MFKGMLFIDKPEGWTSFDVVNYVRRMVARLEEKKPKNVKVGHTGTLDPFASGLLILLVGKDYTRKAGEYSKLDKTYEVTLKLGEVSTTGDPEGVIEKVSDTQPTEEDIKGALKEFQGQIEQVPPAFSAIKVNGQRAYKLARGGKEVELEPRIVNIYELSLVSYDFPEVVIKAHVSSGTYIRSLVKDLGEKLRTGAYTYKLRRTSIESYSVSEAIGPDGLNEENLNNRLIV